jgi:hypothetical protein
MCENCKELFDLKENLPYLIPCGHTICQKCLNSFEFKNNKMKCPIDSHVYEITKEKIPKNEMLIEYIQNNKSGPKYSYQIKESEIEEATFCHVVRRNCFQKICHFLYILIYIKLILRIINLILWPFKKIYQLIRKIFHLIYILYLKIKAFFKKIINKIKSIKLPKININCKCFYKIKENILHLRLIKAIIRFCKYTIRAPLWINYLKIMTNLLNESMAISNNKCFKLINLLIALAGIILAHLIAYLTNNLENFFIILLILNESVNVLISFMKMDEEKESKKYIKTNNKNIKNYKRKNTFGMGNYMKQKTYDEEDEEYLIDENKYHRGKKCITRWIGFLLFWYFFPMIKRYLFNFIEYWESSKNIDLELQEKKIKIWTGVVNSLLFFPKLLIVIYLTC